MSYIRIFQTLEILKRSILQTNESSAKSIAAEKSVLADGTAAPFWNITHTDLVRNWTLENYEELVTVNTFTRDALVISFYSLIVFTSLFGNFFVFRVVFSKSGRKSATNLFIGNLAISDLILGSFSAPFHVVRLLTDNWFLGKFFCLVVSVVQSVSVYASTLTMTCIALDRYCLIVKPFQTRSRMTSAKVKITFIWLLALASSTPYAVFSDVKEVLTYRKLVRCIVIYPEPSREYRKWITLGYFFTLYVAPLGIAGIAYARIIYILWYRRTVGAVTDAQRLHQQKTKWKSIKMLMLVVVIFAICWLPLNVYHIYNDCFSVVSPWKHRSTVFLICHWFAVSNVCYNPFIYCCLNETFRRSICSYFTCLRKIFSFGRSPRAASLVAKEQRRRKIACRRINRTLTTSIRSHDSSHTHNAASSISPSTSNFSKEDASQHIKLSSLPLTQPSQNVDQCLSLCTSLDHEHMFRDIRRKSLEPTLKNFSDITSCHATFV